MSVPDTFSLPAELAAQQAMAREQIPDEKWDAIQNAIQNLRDRNVSDQAKQAGDEAPSFSLPNATGDVVRLDDLLAEGPVVLSFYRGGWCPYCNLELKALQAALPQIRAAGGQLVAVSPQTPDHSLTTQEKHDLDFEVLSDKGNEVAGRYGLLFAVAGKLREVYDDFGIDLEDANGDPSWTLPMPATYVIGTDGTIHYAFVDEDYTHRANPEQIIETLEG